MKECEQTQGQSVYEHGVAVWTHLQDLINYLNDKHTLPHWKIPTWVDTYKKELKESLLPLTTLKSYTIFHDCGKPFCLTIDDQGRRHFPNHAQVSHDLWIETTQDKQVATLILNDMWIHIIKSNEIDSFIELPEAVSLLLVGLCEVHSNCRMFGGIESVSFKSKWKQIDRRGRAICKKLFENQTKQGELK